MSEFTNGVLFLNKHLDEMNRLVPQFDAPEFVLSFAKDWSTLHSTAVPSYRNKFEDCKQIEYLIHQVNNKWSALLIEDSVLNFGYMTIRNWLENTAKIVPLLVFNYGEDHGWTYSLLVDGVIVSQVNINYEIEWYFAYSFLEAKYPHLAGDVYELFETEDIPSLYENIRKSTEYVQAVEKMYSDHHPEQFLVFDMSDEQINQLSDEISVGKFNESFESMQQQVNKFKKILQLEEVTWMSYRYFKKDQEEEE